MTKYSACPRKRGGYSAGDRTVSELPPPPPSVSIRQPGQVPPDHPDAAKPVSWGEHPHDCDCGDCP